MTDLQSTQVLSRIGTKLKKKSSLTAILLSHGLGILPPSPFLFTFSLYVSSTENVVEDVKFSHLLRSYLDVGLFSENMLGNDLASLLLNIVLHDADVRARKLVQMYEAQYEPREKDTFPRDFVRIRYVRNGGEILVGIAGEPFLRDKFSTHFTDYLNFNIGLHSKPILVSLLSLTSSFVSSPLSNVQLPAAFRNFSPQTQSLSMVHSSPIHASPAPVVVNLRVFGFAGLVPLFSSVVSRNSDSNFPFIRFVSLDLVYRTTIYTCSLTAMCF